MDFNVYLVATLIFLLLVCTYVIIEKRRLDDRLNHRFRDGNDPKLYGHVWCGKRREHVGHYYDKAFGHWWCDGVKKLVE